MILFYLNGDKFRYFIKYFYTFWYIAGIKKAILFLCSWYCICDPLSRQGRLSLCNVSDMNASIYIWKREALLENDSVFTPNTGLFIMPEERSIDIDTPLDFAFVDFMLNHANKQQISGGGVVN